MTAREIIALARHSQACDGGYSIVGGPAADAVLHALHAAGYRLLGPDEIALVTTALEHASFALDGVIALDDEDMGKDGGSDTCQNAKKTVDRALAKARSLTGEGR